MAFNTPVGHQLLWKMDVELDAVQELIWRFSTRLDTGESSCNLCGAIFQAHLSTTILIKNHIEQEHGATEEVIELKQFIENSKNFVSIENGSKNMPTDQDNAKKDNVRVSPVWKFSTKLDSGERSCNLCGVTYQNHNTSITMIKYHILKEHGTTEAGVELKQYIEYKAKLDYVNKLPKIQTCKKETKHCKCCAKMEKVEYVCVVCNYKTTEKKSLRNHLTLHNQIVCEQCGFETEKRKMQYHVKKAHTIGTEKLKFKCDHCDYKAKKGNVKSHMRNVHEGVRINCEQCERKFTQYSDLNHHLTKVHGVQIDKTLKCKECNFSTSLRQVMTGHKNKKHEDGTDKKYFCHNCKTSFRCGTSLDRHWKCADTSCSAEMNISMKTK